MSNSEKKSDRFKMGMATRRAAPCLAGLTSTARQGR